MMNDDKLVIAGIEFNSRLWVGTGKYKDFVETKKAIEASGTDVVTVSVRRVNIIEKGKENLLDYIDPKKYKILPNTAGCYTAKDAIRTAMLAAEAGITKLVKLEVIGDQKTLFPDNEATLEAAKVLVKEGLIVLPYTSDDPIMAKKLVDLGCPAVMPLAAPIGSGLGIRNPYNILIIMETVKVP
ncbi:MAG TPA: thiazole synthase, partial [Nitrospirota bacterium]|nr:thiazole synthase [Nitrospirota bacterium]